MDCDLDPKNIYLIRPINLVVQVKAISPFDKDRKHNLLGLNIFELCLTEHNIDEYYYNINSY